MAKPTNNVFMFCNISKEYQYWRKRHFLQDEAYLPQDEGYLPQDDEHHPQDDEHLPQDEGHLPQDEEHLLVLNRFLVRT